MKKLVSILLTLAVAVSLMVVPAVVSASPGAPVIDGAVTPADEWDDYYLGTSVTTWSGGMSVDVYGFADDTYLYAAYVADTSQPGWATTTSMGISANPAYWTPSTTEWPDEGHTILGFGGDGIGQTDGEGWNFDSFGGWGIQDNEFVNAGIEYYVGDPCYNPGPDSNVMELKIPLSLLTYAGTDGVIGLGGQYWQYDDAEPFFVTLPPPNTTVGLTTTIDPDVVCVSVDDPSTADFGAVLPGDCKIAEPAITIRNCGSVREDFTASTDSDFYNNNLTMDGAGNGSYVSVKEWKATVDESGAYNTYLKLCVPHDTLPGEITGTLVIWAERSETQP